MINNKCYYCGSTNLRADRALAGKIICANCGRPYITRNNIIRLNKSSFFNVRTKYLLIFIAIFCLVVFLI